MPGISPVQPASQAVERTGVCAEYRRFVRFFEIRTLSAERAGRVVPASIIAIQVEDRPVAAPHQALRTEMFEKMVDVGFQYGFVAILRGFGDETRQLAIRLLRQGSQLRDAVG